MPLPPAMTVIQFAAWCRGAAAKVADPSLFKPIFPVFRQLAISGMKAGFAAGVGPDGKPWPPPKHRAGKPLRDRGILMAAADAKVTALGVEATNSNVAAALHQFGGTVRAKGKLLAIPLTQAAKRSGGPRQFGKPLHFRGRKGGGRGALVDEEGTAHFALVPSVVVPQRMHVGFSERTLALMGRAAEDFAVKALGV